MQVSTILSIYDTDHNGLIRATQHNSIKGIILSVVFFNVMLSVVMLFTHYYVILRLTVLRVITLEVFMLRVIMIRVI
jgi:hypothetical protein